MAETRMPDAGEWAGKLADKLGDHLSLTEECRVMTAAFSDFQRETLLAAAHGEPFNTSLSRQEATIQ